MTVAIINNNFVWLTFGGGPALFNGLISTVDGLFNGLMSTVDVLFVRLEGESVNKIKWNN